MKSLHTYVALGVLAFLTACGGSAGKNRIPDGRSNLSLADFQLISPANGSDTPICLLNTRIRIAVPKEVINGQEQGLFELIEDGAPLGTPSIGLSRILVDQTYSATQALIEGSPSDRMPAGRRVAVVLRPTATANVVVQGKFATFMTMSVAQNDAQCNDFMTQDGNTWKTTSILDNQIVNSGGDLDISLSDWGNLLRDLATNTALSWIGVAELPTYAAEFRANRQLSGFLLNQKVAVYYIPDPLAALAQAFGSGSLSARPVRVPLNNCVEGDDLASCIRINPNNLTGRSLIIYPPSNYNLQQPNGFWAAGGYIAFIYKTNESTSSTGAGGVPLDHTYYKAWTVGN